MKLLLDENLTPTAALVLQGEGFDVIHVRDRGLLGLSDRALLEWAYVHDRILVTLNVDDFAAIAQSREIHAGLVLMDRGGLYRFKQIEALRAIIAALVDHGPIVNEALWVSRDGAMGFIELP